MCNEDDNIQDLTGKILLSTGYTSNIHLNKSMIYVCSHDANGAMGVIINKLIPNMNICTILKKLNLSTKGVENLDIHFGGSEETDRCFILHSDDWLSEHSTIIRKNIALTVNSDVINVITSSGGPEKKLLSMGCCMWDKDQLENEVAASGWIPIDADEALIFGNQKADKWSKGLLKIGSKTNLISSDRGNA